MRHRDHLHIHLVGFNTELAHLEEGVTIWDVLSLVATGLANGAAAPEACASFHYTQAPRPATLVGRPSNGKLRGITNVPASLV